MIGVKLELPEDLNGNGWICTDGVKSFDDILTEAGPDTQDPKLPVGVLVVWLTADNGEGINELVDLLSRPSRVETKGPNKGCEREIKFSAERIASGNIQVLH